MFLRLSLRELLLRWSNKYVELRDICGKVMVLLIIIYIFAEGTLIYIYENTVETNE